MEIVAFDPGKTTGMASALLSGKLLVDNTQSFDCSGNFAKLYWGWKNMFIDRSVWHNQVFVVEDYKVRSLAANAGQRLWSVEVIALLRLIAQELHIEMVFQTPSQAKQLWPDARLQAYFPDKATEPHEKDALRHLLTFCETKLEVEFWNGKIKVPTEITNYDFNRQGL